MPTSMPRVSFVLATHNRQAVVSDTLRRLERCGLPRRDYEIVVVDNASADGTPEAIADRVDTLITLSRNAGSCAKALGVTESHGAFVVFLDDDSSPRPGSMERMLKHFADDPRLGTAGFAVHLPDGSLEGAALPDVFVGCGVGFRREALDAAGGLDASFFMQAEEYDLAFRLAGAGWTVRTFDDLHVDHLKTRHARRSERTACYDIRNNLRVVARYLPAPAFRAYREDCLSRYRWLAEREGFLRAHRRGVRAGSIRGLFERWTFRRRRMAPKVFEHFYRWGMLRERMARMAADGIRRVLLADLGKNAYAFYQAARSAGLTIEAVADDRFAAPGRRYRGVPIEKVEAARGRPFDAVVVNQCGSVFAWRTAARWRGLTDRPVFDWFGTPPPMTDSTTVDPYADDTTGRVEKGKESTCHALP